MIICIQHGGKVNAADNVQQTALHWAAVRGSVAAADVLLENGARVEASDVNGYRVKKKHKNMCFIWEKDLFLSLYQHQAVHIAAQYGQTGFLNHIVSKYGADFDSLDNDGRSPLHW